MNKQIDITEPTIEQLVADFDVAAQEFETELSLILAEEGTVIVEDIPKIDGYKMLADIHDEIQRTALCDVTSKVQDGDVIALFHLQMLNEPDAELEAEREKERKEMAKALGI